MDEMTTVILALAENSIQLVPDGTIVLHALLILLMVALLNKTLFQPINSLLRDREKQGRGRLAEASEIRKRIERNLAEYETVLRAARADGYRLTEVERSEQLRERAVQVAAVKSDIGSLVESEKALIKKTTEEVRSTLALEVEALAWEIRTRILRRPVVDFRRGR